MSTQPKWTEEREAELLEIVGTESPVSLETVAKASETLGNSTRSIASKLRKMEKEVQSSTEKPKSFTEAEEEALRAFVEANPGMYTYKDIAVQVMNDEDYARKVQGKLLSMELTDKVKKAEPKEAVRTYSEAEEALIVDLANSGKYLEDIAEALGKELNSVRGKCLSMLKTHGITYPAQKNKKDTTKVDVLSTIENISEKTVAEIAEETGKTERGIKLCLHTVELVYKTMMVLKELLKMRRSVQLLNKEL
jgi:arsenate reductase-like glutaredoxin family protein